MKRDLFLDDVDAALDDAAQRYRRERYAFDRRNRLDTATRRHDASAWSEMAEMGWLGVNVAEADGGLGRRIGSMALLSRVAGAAGITEPLLSSAFVAGEVLGAHASEAQRARWLPALMQGNLRVACAFGAELQAAGGKIHGRCEVVLDGDIADLILLQSLDGRWHAVAGGDGGLQRTAYPLLDGRGAATLVLRDCQAEPLEARGRGAPRLVAAFGAAADALGAMEVAHELTLDYIKTRRQFNATIGSNQALVHRAVDMYLRLEESRAVLAQAAEALAAADDARAFEVHAAKAFIPAQGRLLAQEAVQLHGGIGVTEECGVSHCLRRILVDEQIFGGTREHLHRFADQSLQGGSNAF